MSAKWTSRHWAIATALLAAFVTILVYSPGLRGPFVFDDLTNIVLVKQLQIEDLSWEGLKNAIFAREGGGLQRPVAMFSFAFNYYFTKFDPFFFRAINIGLHLLNGYLIFLISVGLLKRVSVPPERDRQIYWTAATVTAIWLIHPINLTSVIYIVQRMTELATLFILCGVFLYTKGRELIIHGRRIGFTVIGVSLPLCLGLAIFSKETGILLLPLLMLTELLFYRFEAVGGLRRQFRIFWSMALVLPLALGAIYFAMHIDRYIDLNTYRTRDFTLYERVLTEGRVLWLYLRLILIPNLGAFGFYHDDFVLSHGLFAPSTTLMSLIAIGALLITAVVIRKKAPVAAFGILWFFIGQSLESTVLPLELVHEHRNYLPLYGVIFALVYYALKLASATPAIRVALYLALAGYAALLSSATYARASEWKDELTLYTNEVRHHPNSARANTMLAVLLHDNKAYDAATTYFKRAVELNPTDSTNWIRLTQHTFIAHGAVPPDLLESLYYALRHYRVSSITLWTFSPLLPTTVKSETLNRQLCKMYEELLNRNDINAGDTWRESVYRDLAFNFRELKDYDKALHYFNAALALHPDATYASLSAAEIYLRRGNVQKAKQAVQKLIDGPDALDKDDIERLNKIKEALKR